MKKYICVNKNWTCVILSLDGLLSSLISPTTSHIRFTRKFNQATNQVLMLSNNIRNRNYDVLSIILICAYLSTNFRINTIAVKL
jgi:hypothetical protein